MKEMDVDAAREVANGLLTRLSSELGDALELLPEETKAVHSGWVFFYNSADYVRTGNAVDALAGNGPIFVSRDGCVRLLDSADDWVNQL